MKKMFLATAASLVVLSSTVFADMEFMDNQWYLRLDAGATRLHKEKDKLTDLKMKPNTSFLVDVGAGCYITDKLRADLTIGASYGSHLKKTGNVPVSSVLTGSVSVKHKPNIIALFANGYVDFANFDIITLYAGAGLGAGFVKDKFTYEVAGIGTGNSTTHSASTKRKVNFIYQLSLGASAEISEGIKAELFYRWADYGKAKSKKISISSSDFVVEGVPYKGHGISAGLRFDL